jgi:broad specificity phosphatase PhoE
MPMRRAGVILRRVRSYLERLADGGYTLVLVVWIYLRVGDRFLGWRTRCWLQHIHKVESTQTHMKQTLLIIRHGQTQWNVEHRLPGQLPGVLLNEAGREQAIRLAESLKVLPISAIISSPLERARDTAEIIGQRRELDVQFEPDLMDTNIGPWAGQTIDEITKKDPAWKEYVRDPTVAPEGVETFIQVQQRVVAAVERWRVQEKSGAYPVFVAHADVIKLLVAHYMGLETKRAGSLFIDNASVSLIEINENGSHIVSIGWCPRPGWLKPPVPETPKSQELAQEVGEQKA